MNANGTVVAHEPCGLEFTARGWKAAFDTVEIGVFGHKFRCVGGNVFGVKVVGGRESGVAVLRSFPAAIVQFHFRP